MDILGLLGRTEGYFDKDISRLNRDLHEIVGASRFLIIGGAGSIGQAVSMEIFKRNPRALHIVDISENNLVELVRKIRSSFGYIDGDFRTFALDCGGLEFQALISAESNYDYVLNLSAMKHVRSERDPYTLMRLIEVNIMNVISTCNTFNEIGVKKYFCVSTDKATNPVNMMGASKRIMEMFLMRESESIDVSMARFANVAFSDGSLLFGFNQRYLGRQPISAPNDVMRYFITPQESGELCLLSCLLGENRNIFFPKLTNGLELTKFTDIACRYLNRLGFEPFICNSEDEARFRAEELIKSGKWPVYFFSSDTTGEKEYEEFYTDSEELDMSRFAGIGVIQNRKDFNSDVLDEFFNKVREIRASKQWSKEQLVDLFSRILPEFVHHEKGKYLDSKM